MSWVLEQTVWSDPVPNHKYLLDGDKILAYIKVGDTEPFVFKNPIQIDKRGRKFKEIDGPDVGIKDAPEVRRVRVAGSKGNMYTVTIEGNSKTCDCPGFTFRGTCKHIDTVL